jgi:Ca2+-binding EF-hand superfamily protein
MRALGMNPSADQLGQLVGGPFAGGVKVGPFTDHLKSKRGEYLDNVDEILEAFRVFDKDNTDMVSKKQLLKTMTTMGETLEVDEVKAFFAGVEAGCGDGDAMEYKAFVQQMMDK